jgi:hypothetical protein
MNWEQNRPSDTTSYDTNNSEHLDISKEEESIQRGMIEDLDIGCFPKRDYPIEPSIRKRFRAFAAFVR